MKQHEKDLLFVVVVFLVGIVALSISAVNLTKRVKALEAKPPTRIVERTVEKIEYEYLDPPIWKTGGKKNPVIRRVKRL